MGKPGLKCPKCGEKVYQADPVCFSCGAELRAGRRQAPAQEPATAPTPASATHAPPAPGPIYATASGQGTPVSPDRVPMGGGFFDRLSRGWAFMKQSLVMWRENPGLVVPSVLSLLSLLAFYGLLYVGLKQFGLWERFTSDEHDGDIVEYAIGIPVLLLAYIISYFYVGMTIHLVDAHLKGRKASLGEAYADSCKNLPAMVLLAGLSTIVSLIANKIRDKSLLGGVAAGVAEAAWHAATYLILPVIIIEDLPLKAAMKRGVGLHKGHFTDLLIAEFGVRLITQVIGVVAAILAVGQGVAFVAVGGTAMLVLAIVIGAAVISVALVFATYLRTAYYTCLYLWAAALEEASAPVPAPAPLAYTFA